MDQTRAREIARDATEQASDTASEAAKRVGEQLQPALDQGKSMAQDLADQTSEVGKQAMDRFRVAMDAFIVNEEQVLNRQIELEEIDTTAFKERYGGNMKNINTTGTPKVQAAE